MAESTGLLTRMVEEQIGRGIGDPYSSEHGEFLREGQKAAVNSMTKFLEDIEGFDPEEVAKHREELQKRMYQGNFQQMMAIMGARAGIDGAAHLMAAISEYNQKLQFTLDELNSNPRQYLAQKRAQIQEALYTGQSMGQLFASMPDTDIHAMQIQTEASTIIGQILLQDSLMKRREMGEDAIGGTIGGLADIYEQLRNAGLNRKALKPLEDLIEEQLLVFDRGRGTQQRGEPDPTADRFRT